MPDREHLESPYPDINEERLAKLRELFPEAFTEGRLDIDKLRETLGEQVNTEPERYNFTWAGKRDALNQIRKPSWGTLVPAKDESVDFDHTKHIFIEGENLEVLKLLYKSYYGRVKMIYIDPPYNKGKDRVYSDKWDDPKEYYLQVTRQKDSEGNLLTTNTGADGRLHSNWLSMMYPRLFLSRQLLTDDGILIISIDEDELVNVQKLCCEIFGEENVLGNFPVIMNLKGNQDAFGFAETHEYIVICAKNKPTCTINKFDVNEEEVFNKWKEDEYGLYKEADNLRATGINAPRSKRPNLYYPIFLNIGTKEYYVTLDDTPLNDSDIAIYPINKNGVKLSWYWSKETFIANKHNLILKKTTNGWQFYRKQRPDIGNIPTKKPKSFFYKPEYSTSTATTDLLKLMGKKVFSNPKPIKFIVDLIRLCSDDNSLVLDYFAGSSTTGHAIFYNALLNRDNRHFILVQIPEILDINNNDQKIAAQYCMDIDKPCNIAELSKERLRKAIQDFAEEPMLSNSLGFRVFKLQPSHIRKWQPLPPDTTQEEYLAQLEQTGEPLLDGWNVEEVIYEIILAEGLSLTSRIEQVPCEMQRVYKVVDDEKQQHIYICLNDSIDYEYIKSLNLSEDDRFICRDSALDDTTVANLALMCRVKTISEL
jgi:adenine-specific DNA-methyltransferase